jgi:hypothetical protein
MVYPRIGAERSRQSRNSQKDKGSRVQHNRRNYAMAVPTAVALSSIPKKIAEVSAEHLRS